MDSEHTTTAGIEPAVLISTEDDPQSVKRIAFGSAIKSLGNKRYGGYLVKFTNSSRRDLQGEYFDAETDFCEQDYPILGRPVLYQHGLDPVIGIHTIGQFDRVEKRTDGIYVEYENQFAQRFRKALDLQIAPEDWKAKQFDLADEYEKAIDEIHDAGKMAFSSGALPQGVQVDETGHIRRWPIIEGSDTPTPAMPQDTRIQSIKSLPVIGLKELLAKEAPTTPDESSKSDQPQRKQKTMDMEKIRALLQELMAALADEEAAEGDMSMAMSKAEEDAAATAAAETVAEEEKASGKSVSEERLMEIVGAQMKAVLENKHKADAKKAALVASIRQTAKANQEAQSKVNGYSEQTAAKSARDISVSENLKYAHLSASDMQFGHELMLGQVPEGQRSRIKSLDIVTEDYLRHMVAKTAAQIEKQPMRDYADQLYVKSVMKANEIDVSTGNTGFGPEWVGQVWSTQIWEKARVMRVYETLLRKGMMNVEVPQGASTVNIQTEEADPTVYSYPQTADLSSGQPPTVLNVTPFGTGTVALAPGSLGLASVYSVILEEDSVIPILPQLNYQMNQKMMETIEQLIVNGDTETAANTNINLIDGTPGTGTSRPYYLASNGLLKYPLVTATALSRSAGGSLALNDFRATIALLAPQFQTRLDNLLWMVDPYVTVAALALPEIQTDDVRRTNATITSGVISNLYGIDVVNEGFMLKANNAGKVLATPSSNTLGRFLLVYAPYWALGFKRQIKIEQFYNPLQQARVVTATMRMGLINRGRDAACVTYNVGIT